MAKKKMYTFSERRHSRKGITSTVLGSISVVIFIALTYFAWWSYGEGGAILGSLGVTGIVFALCGLVSGLTSFRENISCIRFPRQVPSSAVWRWCCGSS